MVRQKELEDAVEVERTEEDCLARKRDERGRKALHKEHMHRKYRNMLDQLDQAHRDHYLSAFLRGSDCNVSKHFLLVCL